MFSRLSRQLSVEDLPWVERQREIGTTAFKVLAPDVGSGQYAVAVRYPAGAVIGRHRHLMPVYAYTLQGTWRYEEHDWIAPPGSFVSKLARPSTPWSSMKVTR